MITEQSSTKALFGTIEMELSERRSKSNWASSYKNSDVESC